MKTFREWLELKEHAVAKKLPHKEKNPQGVRSMKDDLSKDYPGNLKNMGYVYPFKVLKK